MSEPKDTEFIVHLPKENTDSYSGFTRKGTKAGNPEEGVLELLLQDKVIDPVRFPRAVDLFAGDGAVAERLIRNGWKAENVTCIDIAKPKSLIADVKWRYLDLTAYASALARGEIPSSEEFDLAFMTYGSYHLPIDSDKPETFVGSFVKENGIIIVEGDIFRKEKNGMLIPVSL